MAHKLTEIEWDELVELIAASPSGRLDVALHRVAALPRVPNQLAAIAPRSTEDWLVYLASVSSGDVFDRAFLVELRRLSLH
jgi:hypothetical protein